MIHELINDFIPEVRVRLNDIFTKRSINVAYVSKFTHRDLLMSFSWASSKEGLDYWINISNNLDNYLMKKIEDIGLNDYILVETKEEYLSIKQHLHDLGMCWSNGTSYMQGVVQYPDHFPFLIYLKTGKWNHHGYLNGTTYKVSQFVDTGIYENSTFDPSKVTIFNRLLSISLQTALLELPERGPVIDTILEKSKFPVGITKIRNITITSDQRLTYCPAGKWAELSDNSNWLPKNRQEGKIGKTIRKIIDCDQFTDSEIEQAVYLIQSSVKEGGFEIVEGEDIRKWYHYNMYADGQGSLNDSCMRHESCQEFFDIYCNNPEKVKMLILVKNDKLLGRALLWQTDTYPFMDRIYGKESTIKKFKKWAVDNEYAYKVEQSYNNSDFIYKGEEYYDELVVENLNIDMGGQFPYCDTFKYLYGDSLRTYDNGNHDLELTDTEGCNNRIWDDVDEQLIDEDDAVYIEDRDLHTHYCNAVQLYNGCYALDGDNDLEKTINGEYILISDSEGFIETPDGWEQEEDVFYCEYDEVYYSYNLHDSESIADDTVTVKEENVDDWYKENGYVYDNESKEWVILEEA